MGVATVKMLYDKMKTENATRAILVIHGKLSPFVKSSLAGMEDQYRVEVFQEQELLVNITKHVLVPEHRVLTSQEKKALLTQYKLREDQLPRITVPHPFTSPSLTLCIAVDGPCGKVLRHDTWGDLSNHTSQRNSWTIRHIQNCPLRSHA